MITKVGGGNVEHKTTGWLPIQILTLAMGLDFGDQTGTGVFPWTSRTAVFTYWPDTP